MRKSNKFEDKEVFFRKELRRRFEIIKNKYKKIPTDGRRGYAISGTWGGVIECIEDTSPYIKKRKKICDNKKR